MFAERLRIARKKAGLSQIALAEKLGLSQQAVGKWETNRSTPDPATLCKIADICETSSDYLLGRETAAHPASSAEVQVPVVGTVKAGYGALAFQEDYGAESANVCNPADYFYLVVTGDSMEPRIHSGDLALVHRQRTVESGELAVVLIDGEEGTLKRVIKKHGAIILQPFNQEYEAQVYIGDDILKLTVVGKVVETKTRW